MNAFAADPARVTCAASGDHVYPNGFLTAGEQHFVALSSKQFSARYGNVAKRTFGAIEIRAALVVPEDAEPVEETRLLHAGFAVHRGGATRYYELRGRKDGEIRVFNDSRSDEERAHEPRIRVAYAGDPSLPLLRLEWTGSYMGAHASGSTRSIVFLDFREKPRVAKFGDCYDGWMGGACTAYDELYSTHQSFDCAWDAALADVVCRETQALNARWTRRRSTRRFALFGGKELPVRAQSVRSLEALARGPRGEHFVEGVGPVKPVGTIAGRWFVYASAGTGHTLTARLWSVDLRDPKGPIRHLPVQLLEGGDPEKHNATDDVAPEKDWQGKPLPRFTPDAMPFRIETKRLTTGASPGVLQLVLRDGKESRGTFWIGGDAKSGAIAALRVSSDAGEYTHCNTFVHPAAAASIAVTAKPFLAKLGVEPAWTEEAPGDEAPKVPASHPWPATVTWRDGFQISKNQ